MSVPNFVFVLVTVLLWSYTSAQSAMISPDEDMCTNGEDNVTYTCSGGNDFILWSVETRQLRDIDDSTPTDFEGIYVNTSQDNNGTYTSTIVLSETGLQFLLDTVGGMVFDVACLVEITLFNIIEVDNRTITIYSTPPPPENLQLIPINILSYKIQWTRPSSAADCVIISYLVTVINTDTGIANPEEKSETSEMYIYNETVSNMCQLHEIQVSSLNDGGNMTSQPSIITATLPISPNVENLSSSLMATPLFDGGIQIEIRFQPATTCNETTHPIINYLIEITELPDVISTVPHTGSDIIHILSSPSISEDVYSIIVSACAEFGCRAAQPVTVVTSELRDATITFLNTTVSLECVFAITGSAQGCRFTLTLPDGGTEIMDIDRPDSGGLAQQCATTQNRREAYLSFIVEVINSDGVTGSFELEPFVNVTEDLADIAPCELPPPVLVTEVEKESTLSTGEIVAIIIAVLVIFSLLVIGAVIIVWWKRQDIRSAYKHWVHPLTDEDGIDLMLEGEEDKPTIMMLINKLIPRSETSTTASKKKSLTREVSQQPDLATTNVTKEGEVEMGLRNDGAKPPPTLSGKEPVASIKIKDPNEPNALQLLLKPAILSRVVAIWKSKINPGGEMLLYWKEDEEDVDDDEPYYEDPDEDST